MIFAPGGHPHFGLSAGEVEGRWGSTWPLSIWGSPGSFLGGVMTEHIGWESVFLAVIPIGLAVLALTILCVREERGGEGGAIDVPGSFVYSISLVALMYGFSRIQEATGIALVLAGIAGMLVFLAWEKRARHPLLKIDLITRNRQFAMSNLPPSSTAPPCHYLP